MKRVVSVWLPTFATDRSSRRRRPSEYGPKKKDWRSRPLVTVTAAQGGLRLAATNRAARDAGAVPGMPLADARALVPGLGTFEADPVGDGRALAALADWCGRYTPWTAVDVEGNGGLQGAGGLWLDITGCAHLLGGEAALLEDLVARLDTLGFGARAAVADTPGAAWAATRLAATSLAESGTGGTIVVPVAGTRRMLAPLPVAGLRLDPATVEALHRVGLRRVGDLLALPRAPLAARFGEAVTRRLDQALGRLGEPISPRRPVPSHRVRIAFAEPVRDAGNVAEATRRLLARLCARLEREHQGARRLELTLFRVDGTLDRAAIGTSRPVRDPDHLRRLFEEKLKGLDAGFGVEVATLAATAVDPLVPVQASLDSGIGAPSEGGRDSGIDRLIDRLGNRLGSRDVVRLALRASHVPERASREEPILGAPPRNQGSTPDEPGAGEGHAPPRPIRLLPSPEPIEVIAPLPDHPPAMFRWRRAQHRVAEADGPERIAPEWWLEDPRLACRDHRIRDYYRVEDTEGRRFWIYREGTYRPGIEPRWYLHGFFA